MRWLPTSTSSATSSSHRRRNAGRRERRRVRLAVAFFATADRVLASGVPPPDDCSRRSWHRCSWCESAQCSGTRRARERCPDRPGRFRAAEARPARVHSGARSWPVGWAPFPGSGQRPAAADGPSSARSHVSRPLGATRPLVGLVHEDPDVALGFGQRQRALQRCDRSWAVTSRL